MSHTYASVDDFKKFLIDGGQADWDDSDALILALLEGASRRIDGYCDRSTFGSGFGPRIAANRYDLDGARRVLLRDDFVGFTSLSMLDGTGGGTATLTLDTDVYAKPYSGPPYTELEFTGLGVGASSGLRVLTVAGTAGYPAESVVGLTMGTATAAATSLTLSAGSAYAGQTLLNQDEQMYITASDGTALTVVRGVNGTTAAVHAAGQAVTWYRYEAAVHSATLQLAARRQRSAQSGVQGDFGGGGLPIVGHRDTEHSILRASVGHLRHYSAG